MERALNVAHVVLALDVGGLERVVLDLAREGSRLGQRVSIVCLERRGGLAPQFEELGVPVLSVDKPPGLRPGTGGKVRRVLGEIGANVVHTHQIGGLFYAGPAAKRAGVPVVVHTEHGKHFDGRLRTRVLGRLAARHAQRYFCVSQDIAASVLHHRIAPRSKVEVVPNGIETGRFGPLAGSAARDPTGLRQSLGIPPGAPIVGTVGNLREVKRQDVLIRGFAKLGDGLPVPPHLVLVGDGPCRAELEQLAKEVGVAGRVHFAGRQSRPEQFLRLMHVFALTSRSEGMPLAVLEAWAAGLPVVASRVGGLPELIRHGQNGLLFESGDDAELAGHLARLLSDRDAAARLGEAAQALARARFDVSVMAGTYERHYRELLARPRP